MNHSDPPSAGDGNPGSRATTTLLACHRRSLSFRTMRSATAKVRRVAVRAFEREFGTTGSSHTQGAERLRGAADKVPGTR
ncbi:hypothetical protein GCM10007858_73850 [Bradyrhizobium liaoningense]|nr:hypothetical protein GCM10007858_73850 [Bradyrhizobium liaoningense]